MRETLDGLMQVPFPVIDQLNCADSDNPYAATDSSDVVIGGGGAPAPLLLLVLLLSCS